MYSLKFTGAGRRVIAFLIDLFIIFILTLLLSFILKLFFLIFDGVKGTDTFEENVVLIRSVIGFLISFIYFSFLTSTSLSSTLGQFFLKIKVVDYEENHITFPRSIGRYFGVYLSVLSLGLGLFMALYNPNRQTLHDKLCKTYVIDR